MSYLPPAGWLERIDDPRAPRARVTARFHLKRDCPQIQRPKGLVQVDRPYHGARCNVCATS